MAMSYRRVTRASVELKPRSRLLLGDPAAPAFVRAEAGRAPPGQVLIAAAASIQRRVGYSDMARQMHPRRGSAARLGAAAPPSLSLESGILAELAAMREKMAAVEQRLAAPAAEAQAMARSADAQWRKLDELAATLGEVWRRQGQAAELLADLREPRSRRTLLRLAGSLHDAVAAVARRVSGRIGRWGPPWRAERRAPQTAEPTPAPNWVLAGAQGRGQCRAVLALVFGLDPAEAAALAARLPGKVPAGVIPVFVTDHNDFAPYRAQRACFEYLPDRRVLSAGATPRDLELYRARRLALLCDKWKPLRVVAFGAEATQQLARWSRSPHLSESVRELLSPETAAGAPDEALAHPPAR
jgi:hypothetical protein